MFNGRAVSQFDEFFVDEEIFGSGFMTFSSAAWLSCIVESPISQLDELWNPLLPTGIVPWESPPSSIFYLILGATEARVPLLI